MDNKVSEILGDRDPEAVPGFEELKSQATENVLNLVAAVQAIINQKMEQQHRQQIDLIHQLLDRPVDQKATAIAAKLPAPAPPSPISGESQRDKRHPPKQSKKGSHKMLIANGVEFERLKDEPIPKFSFKQIYKRATFDMDIKHRFRRLELSIPPASKSETDINLITGDCVQRARRKGYRFLHIGAVQVAFKLLARKDLGASVMAVLRDNRMISFNRSLLGAIQADLNTQCAYFNVLPDSTVHLENASNSLKLRVQTQGTDVREQFRGMTIQYRVYYKLMKTAAAPKMKLRQQPGVTTLLHSHPRNHTYNPQPIKWEDVTFPEHWKITGTNK